MVGTKLDFYKFVESLKKYRNLDFNAYKYSYIIVKPNGARHFKTYVNELSKHGFDILGYYAILDYETINIKLHKNPDVQKYISNFSLTSVNLCISTLQPLFSI